MLSFQAAGTDRELRVAYSVSNIHIHCKTPSLFSDGRKYAEILEDYHVSSRDQVHRSEDESAQDRHKKGKKDKGIYKAISGCALLKPSSCTLETWTQNFSPVSLQCTLGQDHQKTHAFICDPDELACGRLFYLLRRCLIHDEMSKKKVAKGRAEMLSKGASLGDWKVEKKLGSGAFGAVYRVSHAQTKEEFAMKVEGLSKDDDSMLVMEVAVLKTFRASIEPHPHVCDYVDSGMTETVRYLVMKLAGPNLADVRKSCPRNRLSDSTTIRLGIQCVQSIESLHRIGFVHRDIKPPNYAIGVGDSRRIVYLLDFGLSRQYVDRHGHLRPPRNKVGFRGTLRYASVNAHLKRDLGRHDDLWSLLYMLIELRMGKLPWKNIGGRHAVAEMKKDILADVLLKGMPLEFHQFLNELQGLQFHDTPNYKYFCEQLEAAMKQINAHDGDPYDWEITTGVGHRMAFLNLINLFKKHRKEEKIAQKVHEDEERSRLSLRAI